MARGKIYPISDLLEVVHHMPIEKYNSWVSIDEPIMSYELLLISIKDEYMYVGGTKRCFVAWPKSLDSYIKQSC